MPSLNGPYTLINILGTGNAVTGYKLKDVNGIDVIEILNNKGVAIELGPTEHDLALAFQSSLNTNDVPYLTKLAKYFGAKGQQAFVPFAASNAVSILDSIKSLDGPTAQAIANAILKVNRILDPGSGPATSLFGPYSVQAVVDNLGQVSSYRVIDKSGVPISEMVNGKIFPISLYSSELPIANSLATSLSTNDAPYLARIAALGGDIGETALTRAVALDAIATIRAIATDTATKATLEEAAEILIVLA